MQVTKEILEPTRVKLSIVADQLTLGEVKQHVLQDLGRNAKVPGFRPGKAPQHLIEKQINPSTLQSEFLDHAVNQLYVEAAKQERLRPVAQPNVTITKFVPFTTLEITAEVDVVGDIKLADYKKIKLPMKTAEVSAKDVTEVLENLSSRGATKKPVKRAAKDGDEVLIDFVGTDAKTKKPIESADGIDYPLTLGSKSFIPGFEEKLLGMKAGVSTEFILTFPKDYSAAALQNRKVNFAVTIKEVRELVTAKIDDAFAATLGPFKTLTELKTDIKKQLKAEREQEARQSYDNELLETIAKKSTVSIPTALVEEEMDRIEEEEKRNVVYRGQTWQEHLDEEKVTQEAHRERSREGAELRVKAGLVLGEVVEREGITVSPDELSVRLQLLKGQYSDPAMQSELDKPDSRRDIGNRMLSEKALDKLRTYANAS
jgi:trigger factor